MFLFNCCKSVQSSSGYEITTKNDKNEIIKQFVSSLDGISKKELSDKNTQIMKIEKSSYNDLMKEFKGSDKKWTDISFPPDEQSLGSIPDITTNKWKRLSSLLNKPALFDGRIQPIDVIQGSLGDCYFLSALASLAENQQRIKQVFGDQVYNPNGIYKVTLRVNGDIEEILVDDYIPVNNKGEPFFCQPNKNQFWVLLIEKAWAKAHGNYANIIAGTPTEVFRAVTYAPAETYFIKQSAEERQKIWRMILSHAKKDYPCCCGTDEREDVDWGKIGLIQGHAYTLIDAAELENKNGKKCRMLLMRNPWGRMEWEGEGSENDEDFWNNIIPSQEKNVFLSNNNKANDGIFFISYEDFCKYFSEVHFCLLEPNGNYLSEKLFLNKKNASIFEFSIEKEGSYIFEVHQSSKRGKVKQNMNEGLCRSTLLVSRVLNQNQYQFVSGTLKYNDEDTMLKVQLTPGSYILYAKIDPSRLLNNLPEKCSVSVYSSYFTRLEPSEQAKHPNFLKKLFLNHARQNKRQTYNEGEMWIAWKLLYQEGGYAYIAFGNAKNSKQKFVVTFDQQEFAKLNFKLKKQFKGKGQNQRFEVRPGQEKIILARVQNTTFKGLKFPPAIGIKLQKIESAQNL